MRRALVAVSAGLLLAAAGTALPTTSSAAGAAARPSGYRLTGTKVTRGSTITTAKDGHGDTIKVIAPTGSTLRLPTARSGSRTPSIACGPNARPDVVNPPTCSTPGGDGAGVTVPGDDKSAAAPTRTLSAVQSATALGMDNPQQFAGLDALNSPTSGPGTAGATDPTTGATSGAPSVQGTSNSGVTPNSVATAARSSAKGRAHPMSTVNGAPYGNPVCYAQHFDGGRGYIQACSQRYRTYTNGGDWWFLDKYHGSAKLKDTAIFNKDELTGILLWSGWASHNAVYDWAPAATQRIGSCKTITQTVSVGVFNSGGSSSVSYQQCPDKVAPDKLTPTSYGSHWSGSAGNGDWEETHGEASIHNPSNAGTGYSFNWYCWWD